jgi:hypothetical protein
MAKYKHYDYSQSTLIPVSLEEQLIPGTLEFAIHHLVESRIDTEQGRRVYDQRAGIVEPVFANIRFLKSMDRFTLRGGLKVNIQWVLYCMVHNIGKIARYGFT